jgi:hypothetical protein
VATAARSKLEDRVIKAAEVARTDRHFVTAIDVLMGLGWLTTPQVDEWRQGRVDYLDPLVTANLSKISTAMAAFRQWAQKEGLNPSETVYLSQARDHHPSNFSRAVMPASKPPTEPIGSPRRCCRRWTRIRVVGPNAGLAAGAMKRRGCVPTRGPTFRVLLDSTRLGGAFELSLGIGQNSRGDFGVPAPMPILLRRQ